MTVTSAGAAGSPKTIPVTFTVDPLLTVSPSSLSFSAAAGGASPAAKTVTVGGVTSWTASETASWLSLTTAGRR